MKEMRHKRKYTKYDEKSKIETVWKYIKSGLSLSSYCELTKKTYANLYRWEQKYAEFITDPSLKSVDDIMAAIERAKKSDKVKEMVIEDVPSVEHTAPSSLALLPHPVTEAAPIIAPDNVKNEAISELKIEIKDLRSMINQMADTQISLMQTLSNVLATQQNMVSQQSRMTYQKSNNHQQNGQHLNNYKSPKIEDEYDRNFNRKI